MRYWFGNCADPFKRWEQSGVSIRGFLSGGFYPGVSIIESIDQVKALIKPPTQR